MKYNPDIHHRRSVRLKDYDYSSAGYYFVTICCFNRLPLFGEIKNGAMVLNDCGRIAHNEWLNTINKRENIQLNEFVIMPNHMHGIIHLTENFNKNTNNQTGFQSPSKNLGAIVRGYKSAVSGQLKEVLGHSAWQRNYHEHIIRNEQSYKQIAEYVVNNPILWKDDCFYMI